MPSKSQFEKNFPEEEWKVRNNPLHKGTKKNNNKPKSNRPHATRKGSAASFNFNFFEKVFKGGNPHSTALKVLGFAAGDNPTEKEISKAYKKKALATHPNRGGTKEKFQKLQAAFEFLTGERNSFENEPEQEEEVRTPPPEPAPEPKKRGSVLKPKKSADPYAGMTKEEAAAAEKKHWNAMKAANVAYRAAAEEAPRAAAKEPPRAAAVPPHMRGVNPGTRKMAENIAAGLERAGRFGLGKGNMGPATWNYLHSKRGGGKTRRQR